MKDRLGIDVGGVIIDRINDHGDTSFFGPNYLQTSEVPEAVDAIRELVDYKFGNRVYIVSKCGKRLGEKTLAWMEHHDFFRRTGISKDNIYFCRERHQKAGICDMLGITHFVDDRLEVLKHLVMVKTKYLFQPRPDEVAKHEKFLKHVRQVDSWRDIVRKELRR